MAIHEFGHSLGLKHLNDNKNAIMYPWAKNTGLIPPQLDKMDILQIQALYGGPKETNTTTPTTTSITTTPCTPNLGFDAIYGRTDKGIIYAFRGGDVFVLNVSSSEPPQPPKPIESIIVNWEGGKVDAAFQWAPNYLHLFSGDTVYWCYWDEDSLTSMWSQKISQYIYHHVSDIDAAIAVVPKCESCILDMIFIKGKEYYTVMEEHLIITRSEVKKVHDRWPGLPNERVQAAYADEAGVLHFFYANGKYYRWDNERNSVEYGYPKDVTQWLGCN